MEFSFPVPKHSEILGQFSNKWFDFVSRFHCHQEQNGTTQVSFLLHFGSKVIKDMQECHQLSLEDLRRFSLLLRTLEQDYLFQIVLSFLRYLFFNHCRKTGRGVEDFYTELKLLSDWCSFDSVAVDNFIKNHIISSLQEESVREVFMNGTNLTARDVVDICAKVEEHGGSATPELFHAYLMDQQHKTFQNFSKTKKDYGWSSFQDMQAEITKGLNLSTVFRTDHPNYNDDLRKPGFVDNGSKYSSYSSANFTPMDTLSDHTPYMPNKIPCLGMNFHQTPEGSASFLQPHPHTNYYPSFQQESIMSSAVQNAPPPPPSAPPSTVAPPNRESAKTKVKKGLVKPVICDNTMDKSSSVKDPAITVSTSSAATLSVCKTNYEGLAADSDADPIAETNEEENGENAPSTNSSSSKADGNEIPQSYCSQQKAMLKTSQIMESTGQSIDVYTCNFCVYNCPGKENMEEHVVKEHKSLKCFVCTACNAKFPSKELFETHVRTKHMNIEEHKCQICDMVLSSQKKLFVHLQGHAETRTVSCRVCSAMFSTEKLLSDHMARVHPDTARWSCRVCDANFSTRKSLSDHVGEVHKDNGQDRIRRFMCKLCGINFTDKKSSEMHKRKFHRKPHLRKFPCDICSHVCSSNANLISHRRIHTGEKPYICEVCGKEFAQLSSLDKHTRIHTGEKPYKCQYCDLCFKTSSNRLVHERGHRKERPYVCEKCGKTFRNSTELKMHIETHNEFRPRRFLCHCGAAFDTKRKLKRHEVCHSGVKPFKCEMCGASFTRPENVKGHQKSQACRNRMSKINCSLE